MKEGKIIKGTNDRYMIFPNGVVINVESGKEIKPQMHDKGYLQVLLRVDCKPIKKYIHRLLANYFIKNPKNKPCINHKDGNKLNNELSNLEWCSYSENNKHAYDNNLKTSNAKKVIMLSLNGKKLNTFNSTVEAEQYLQKNGFPKAHNNNISSVANGKRKTAYKFKWRYLR